MGTKAFVNCTKLRLHARNGYLAKPDDIMQDVRLIVEIGGGNETNDRNKNKEKDGRGDEG